YSLSPPAIMGNIIPAALTLTFFTAYKVYDATTAAAANPNGATFVGLLGGDRVTLKSNLGATFPSKDVGYGYPLTMSGLALGGGQGSDYALTSTTAATIASITPAAVTVIGI